MNKKLFILTCFAILTADLKAQDVTVIDSAYVVADTSMAAEESYANPPGYEDLYHFHDSDQYAYNNKKLDPKFDKSYWEKEKKKLNFEEDTAVIEKKEELKQSNSREVNLPEFKFPFIILALLVLGLVIFYLVRNTNFTNRKLKSNILINFDDLDEQTLRDAELDIPLNNAIRNKDFKTAYRIKYLRVLQQLIGRNLIVYRKEKTNYDYLLQLSGQTVYEPFRSLTFNFDGIWYGELFIDEARYNELLPYFKQFEKAMNNA